MMPLRPLLAALILLLCATGAAAQSPVGAWSFELVNPESGETAEGGYFIIPDVDANPDASGSFELTAQGLEADLTDLTLSGEGENFTLSGLLNVGAGTPPFSLSGTVTDDAMEAVMTIGQNELSLQAERTTEAAIAEAKAENAPEVPPVKALFEPFDLPAPNRYRSASGRPGPAYWQQEADYRIDVSLDPETAMVEGTVVLTYTNNSPEALDVMWFHLEQNLFTPDSRGATAGFRATGETLDEKNGYRLGTVTVDGEAVTPFVSDTRMRLDLAEPLPSGGVTEVTIPYSFRVPEGDGTPRMGRLDLESGTVFSMAQWYPRVAVFDDVNGWNTMPYLGTGEFYLEYGDFDLSLTVPATMFVVATGTLQNPETVYTPEQQRRLETARQSDERVYIVRPEEVGTAAARPMKSETLTWRYRAENVRDVAWGASSAFVLDGARAPVEMEDGSINDVLILSAYPPEGVGTEAEPGWEEATRFGRASILNNSYWLPYPYPTAVNVASHIGGMEYPMIHFSSVERRHFSLFGVIDHELAHNWFPMIVGSDERRHAWMDEGFNTFMNAPSNVLFYNENEDTSIAGYGQAEQTQAVAFTNPQTFARITSSFGSAADDEILSYPDHFTGQESGWNSYIKPGMGLTLLREAILGRETFDMAFREYTRRWAFKHPQPADFFRTIEDISGEDLDWFWQGWFNTIQSYDATLSNLEIREDAAAVTVSHVGGLVLPTTVEFTFADGSTARRDVPAESFAIREEVTVSVPAEGREVVSATLDPEGLLPDVDASNDSVSMEE